MQSGWQTKIILGQTIKSVCEHNLYLSAGYPKHPNGNIEYSFSVIEANNTEEMELYKKIVYSNLKFIP